MRKQRPPKAVHPRPITNEATVQPTEEEIATRAHEIYLARGATHGCDLDDWLLAERELKTSANAAITKQ